MVSEEHKEGNWRRARSTASRCTGLRATTVSTAAHAYAPAHSPAHGAAQAARTAPLSTAAHDDHRTTQQQQQQQQQQEHGAPWQSGRLTD